MPVKVAVSASCSDTLVEESVTGKSIEGVSVEVKKLRHVPATLT